MDKLRIILFSLILLSLCVMTVIYFRNDSRFLCGTWYRLQQKFIPLFLEHPKDRIHAYISNADNLFFCAQTETDAKSSADHSFRAEHSMTLLVGEIRRLHNANIISYSLVFDAFTRHSETLNELLQRKDGALQNDFQTIAQFAGKNEKTAKTIYYNAIHPGDIVPD